MPTAVSDRCAEVEGVVEGGEWLRVGERVFLPMKVRLLSWVSVEPGWGRWDHAAHQQGGTCQGGGGGACAQGAEPCEAWGEQRAKHGGTLDRACRVVASCRLGAPFQTWRWRTPSGPTACVACLKPFVTASARLSSRNCGFEAKPPCKTLERSVSFTRRIPSMRLATRVEPNTSNKHSGLGLVYRLDPGARSRSQATESGRSKVPMHFRICARPPKRRGLEKMSAKLTRVHHICFCQLFLTKAAV